MFSIGQTDAIDGWEELMACINTSRFNIHIYMELYARKGYERKIKSGPYQKVLGGSWLLVEARPTDE